MSFDYLMGYIMSISMCMQNSITIFHSVQEIGLFSLFQNLALGKASTNDKCHFAISWTRCRQYQYVCKILSKYSKRFRVIDIFHEQARPVTKSSQTVRWQNQMCDYRALYESQPSVSVDFLSVVQFWFRYALLQEFPQANIIFFNQLTVSAIKLRKSLT